MSQQYGQPPAGGATASAVSTEKSVKSCYAVVYSLVNRKWVVSGKGGWSEVHLCRDSIDNSHRLLAWTVDSQEVLMNANVTAECTYKEKSKNFHSFQDENSNRFGLGFHKSDSGLRQAEHFFQAVRKVIDSVMEPPTSSAPVVPPPFMGGGAQTTNNTSVSNSTEPQKTPPPNPFQVAKTQGASSVPPQPPIPQQSPPTTQSSTAPSPPSGGLPKISDDKPYESTDKKQPEETMSPVSRAVHGFAYKMKQKMSIVNETLPQYHLRSETARSVPQGTPQLGALRILPPKAQKLVDADKSISDVTKVERTVQVIYDKEEGVFHGLPKEWQAVLNKQFGVKPEHLPGLKLPQYTSKVPKVLITLKQRLVDRDGYKQVGIFRLAPNAADSNFMKSEIDKGEFALKDGDVNVYANLIKVWFRDLPAPLLHCVAPERVEMAHKESDVIELVQNFPEPNKSIFLWLCDMCVECAKFEKINKMGPKNLAIVIGPNLFNTAEFENPMKAMTYSGKVVEFFEKAISWRQSV